MSDAHHEWTVHELDELRNLDAQGVPTDEIARRLSRSKDDIEDRLSLLRHADGQRMPEPSFGPDEEGDVSPSTHDTDGDPAAWVHVDRPPTHRD
ncbi:hypothetical protein CLG96_04495 [Sphingomonas oleivorans]|uniref:Uncharacterized protein n=1 Tax=Sphingomonas oleivorans TaxID=1735121 RepID=A0A2T5G2I2_9SPHN|nr:hypothetical protein [Sphingomonas oleivorans]PTQ13362.1 hypothetical protein CLG96_04495 [Sphingomonas oleivorans]